MKKLFIISTLVIAMFMTVFSGAYANIEVVPGQTAVENIFLELSPQNGTIQQLPVMISASLNVTSTCDLYINNQKVFTNQNTLGFTNSVSNLDPGNHKFYVVCSTQTNEGNFFQISQTREFTIESEPGRLQFLYRGDNFDVNDYNLFMVTPCLNEGIVIPGSSRSKYSMINNPDVYFSPLNNRLATFDLNEGEHEFCLIHGIGQYNNPGDFSTEWYINQVQKQEQIGLFNINGGETKTFGITIEKMNIYSTLDPKAWGTSWTEIILGLIAILLGIGLMVTGAILKLPMVVVVGGLISASALGFQIGGLVLALVG